MHAWIGFIFSCLMIVIAAASKSGYDVLPAGLSATPSTQFMFLIGCAGFGGALALLAPNYSSARLASIWSSAALAVVVVVLNLDHLPGGAASKASQVEPLPTVAEPVEKDPNAEEPKINFVFKRTTNEGDFVPFEDFEYRVRKAEHDLPELPEENESNQVLPPRE